MASKLHQDHGATSGTIPSSPASKPLNFHPIERADHDREYPIEASLGKKVSFSEHIGQASGATMARDRHAGQRVSDSAESSADEFTGILGAERGGTRDYSTSTKPASMIASGVENHEDPTGSIRNRRRTPSRPEEEPEKEDSWWKRTVDKYGSVELENKGSVARDHLALGTYNPKSFTYVLVPTRLIAPNRNRANLPRLATNFPLLRQHRHSNYPAFPSQHLHNRWQ
jgi:hypothetical protein